MNENIQPTADLEFLEKVASLAPLGSSLESLALRSRFEGVRENILREIRGGMCTVEQGYAYLENFELRLLTEQHSERSSRAGVI